MIKAEVMMSMATMRHCSFQPDVAVSCLTCKFRLTIEEINANFKFSYTNSLLFLTRINRGLYSFCYLLWANSKVYCWIFPYFCQSHGWMQHLDNGKENSTRKYQCVLFINTFIFHMLSCVYQYSLLFSKCLRLCRILVCSLLCKI